MNRRSLWLFSWLVAVILTRPVQVLPHRFTIAKMQELYGAAFARGTILWLVATGFSVLILKWCFSRGTDLSRSIQAGFCVGISALVVFTLDLFIEVAPTDRDVFTATVIASALAAAFAGFSASYWRLSEKQPSKKLPLGQVEGRE